MTIPQAILFFSVAANFAAGTDTPREFLECCLARLESFEPDVGAFVCNDIAAACAAAYHSAARWRDDRPFAPRSLGRT
jgi:Asp-tRNA(Asn)/Glu-tRNA(Gln) amidotransferase A subunit family amidase